METVSFLFKRKIVDHKMVEFKIILIKNYIHFNNSNFELNKFMTESI